MLGVGRALCGSPSPTPCPSRVTHSRLHSTASSRVWNISREGDSTASLGSLGQGSITLRGKKFFLMFSWSFLCFSLCPLPLVLSLGITGKLRAWSHGQQESNVRDLVFQRIQRMRLHPSSHIPLPAFPQRCFLFSASQISPAVEPSLCGQVALCLRSSTLSGKRCGTDAPAFPC